MSRHFSLLSIQGLRKKGLSAPLYAQWLKRPLRFLQSLFIFLAVFPYTRIYAQEAVGLPFITNYSPLNTGLTGNSWSIMQGNNGVMYFGTQTYGGTIERYDGVNWSLIPNTQNRQGIVGVTRSMAKDSTGTIFYGGWGDFGYLSHDSAGNTVCVSLLKYVPKDKRDFTDIWSIQIAGNSIYFQAKERLFRLTKSGSGKDLSWTVKTWEPKTHFFYSFYLDHILYVHEQGVGLLRMMDDTLQPIPGSQFLGKGRMQVMLPYPADNHGNKEYLIGTFYQGLYLFDSKHFTPFHTEADKLIKSSMLYKAALVNGNYALALMGEGVIMMNPKGKILQVIDKNSGLLSTAIYSLYLDRDHNLWIGTDNSISKVDLTLPFTRFFNQPGLTSSIITMARMPDGSLYAGTENGAANYDAVTGQFEAVKGIPSTQVFSMIPDGNTLLVGCTGLYAVQAKKVILVQPSVNNNLVIANLLISKKYPQILYASSLSGLTVFVRDKGLPGGWKLVGNVPGVIGNSAGTQNILSEQRDGSLWVNIFPDLYHVTLSFDKNGVPDLAKSEVEKFSAGKDFIHSMTAISFRNKMYFLEDSSAYAFNEAQRKFVKHPVVLESGDTMMMPDPGVNGAMWVLSRTGKYYFLTSSEGNERYRLDTTDLRPIMDESPLAYPLPGENGIIWIAGTNGLIRFDTKIKTDDSLSFNVLLNKVTAGKSALNPYTPAGNNAPEIKFKNNSFRFDYAAPYFLDEKKTQYQTRLAGFDTAWSAWGNNTYREYTNLPYGDYVFHVRAKNVYGVISSEATFSFTILPPWYRTWWAYVIYAIIILALLYLIVRWRTRELMAKHRELEKTVAERTADLDNRVKELAVINSVQDGLAHQLNMQAIYDLVGERVRQVFDAQAVIVASLDAEARLEYFHYAVEDGKRFYPDPRTLDKVRTQLIHNKKTILIKNDQEQEEWFGGKAIPGTKPVRSCVFVPLFSQNKVTGYVSLQNVDRENAFSDADVKLLETLANSMSVSLENARLFDETNRLLKETEQRTAELSVINSVQEGLASKLDMQSIYDLVGDRIRSVFPNINVLVIRTFNDDQSMEFIHYVVEEGARMKVPPQPVMWASKILIQTRKPLLINKDYVEMAQKYGNSGVTAGKVPKSALFIPLLSGDKVRGSVSLQDVERENVFSDSDVSLLSTITASMSVSLENARLFDETTRLLKETEQRNAELALINSVQDGLAHKLDMQSIYDMVGNKVQQVFDAQAVVIGSLNADKGLEYFNYIFEDGQRFYPEPRSLDKVRTALIKTKKTILINNDNENQEWFGNVVVPGTKDTRSCLFVPLFSQNNVTGYVSLQNVVRENAFSDADVKLLETLTNSMSVALENARLFDETTRLLKETEQRTAELSIINNVQEGLVREMNIQAIYDLIGDRLCRLFDTQTLVIRTFDLKNEMEYWKYAIENGVRLQSEPRRCNWANKRLIQTRQAFLINENYQETAKKYGGAGVTKGQPPKSAMFVPMIAGGEVKGSVSLQNIYRENAFTDSDVKLLTTLTNSMSVALENARLFDETKQRASELSTVNNISQALASQLDPRELIRLVGDQLRELFNANIVYLALLNRKTKIITFPYQYGDDMSPIKLGEGLTSQIILSGKPLLINKDIEEQRKQMGITAVGTPASSYLGVPIPVGNEIIGVLSVQSTEQENRFNENDQSLLSTIASSVGIAIRNAQLFEDVQQAKKEAEAAGNAAKKANEAKSAFLSTVSHELRTPLTSVLGFARIIQKRLEDKIFPQLNQEDSKTNKTVTQINENLGVVISEGQRLTSLINDVLDLAKIEAGKMEWNREKVSLPEVVERAIAATTSLFALKPVAVIKEIDQHVPAIMGDQDKLIQVVINLISNAAKFTDKGSVICKVYQKDREAFVSVEDTGIGIDKEDYGAVFEQFKQVGGDTLTDKPKGTGLGLPICKEIVEHHGGRIWVESVKGKGSTFTFSLPLESSSGKNIPLHLDDLVKQLKEQMAISSIHNNGHHASILVVDDDDSIRSLLDQELTDAGYLIDQAENGKIALEKIRKNKPDLILLDVMMPEMNGFDVAAILKNDPATMDIPIIILSIVQDKARGYRIGVDRYLTKPIDTSALFAEIGELLEQGKSKRKVMIVDEDTTALRSLTDVLQEKGYTVVESGGKELMEKAIATQPDIIILNSMMDHKNEIMKTLRFEKGLEHVLFFIYQ